jgi:hypothetical protein
MNRERLARIAVRLSPEAGRAHRSDELVGTLLDASDDSRAAFARQLTSVVAAGLAARSGAALSEPLGQVGMNALAWAAVMCLVQGLAIGFEVAGAAEGSQLVIWVIWGFGAAILALFTLGRTRISGFAGLICVYGWFGDVSAAVHPRVAALVLLLVPLAGFGLLAFAPQKVSARGRWLWLAPAAVFALFEVTSTGNQSGVDFIAPVVVALCFLPFKPSFALGTVLAWSAVGALELTLPGGPLLVSVALLAFTPIAVIALSVGRRATRRT